MSAPPAINTQEVPPTPRRKAARPALRRAYHRTGPYFVRYGVLVAFALVVLAFSLARPDSFATWENWKSIFNLGSVVFLMAGVVTVPMIMGDFDLSIGYNTQVLGRDRVTLMALDWSRRRRSAIIVTLSSARTSAVLLRLDRAGRRCRRS